MNIFKVLANGDGSINEPNVSAFLGYLLDPYQDHGLGFEFLERFIEKRVFKNDEGEKFLTRSYDYEIIFEQAFRDEDKEVKKKEIVDIVILCFENDKGRLKESVAEFLITKTRELKYIFLLENKITTGAKVDQQLKAQFENTIARLKIGKEKIISLYVTPDDRIYDDVFEKFVENEKKAHFVWKSEKEDHPNDIYKLLLGLVQDESFGRIEAINEYTKHTLISFLKFIENDFKSQKVEEKENKEGKYKKDILENVEEYFEKYDGNLNEQSNQTLKEFTNHVTSHYPQLFIRHTPTHPISIFKNGKKIFSCSTARSGNLRYDFMKAVLKSPDEIEQLKSLLSNKGMEPKEVDWGFLIEENIDLETLKSLFREYLNIL